jgi:hypothetical protein
MVQSAVRLGAQPSIKQGIYFVTSIYAPLSKVEKKSDGTLRIRGVASSETVDADGEIILASAMKQAIPGFLAHGTGALREMHSASSAAGTVDEVAFDDKTKTTKIVASMVDKGAIDKVIKGVYKGLSVGGRVVERLAENAKVISKVNWLELSLVDRPSNPTSTFSIYKVGNPNSSRDVKNLPSATGRSIDDMWKDLHEASMRIDAMPDGDKKYEARAEHQRAVEKVLAHQIVIRNAARLKAKYDPFTTLDQGERRA